MTEAEWLVCADPKPMLKFLQAKVSDRKLRLFACACCRRIWHLLADPRSRNAVEVAERFADGLASREEKLAANAAALAAGDAARRAFERQIQWQQEEWDAMATAEAAADAAHDAIKWDNGYYHTKKNPIRRLGAEAADAVKFSSGSMDGWAAERQAQAALLRCLLGPPPFASVRPSAAWVTWNAGTVERLARAIYRERAFDSLPILADALEESGCAHDAMLRHCREGGEHVLGCWVVDLFLRKE